jgi:SNF2 family DNA or RNA helicase
MPAAPPYQYRSKPYPFQHECLERSWDKEIFAILFEQGAGKSKVVVDTAARSYSAGRIDTLVVIAPNGVHRKWIEEDMPYSWPEWCGQYKWAIWESGNKKSMETCEDLMKPGPFLRVLCMNVESLSHKGPLLFLKKFLQSTEALVAVDESSRIKNPDAARTENLVKLQNLMKYRRILTGTPVSNSPFDYYSQFMFLDPQIFGCSYYAFKAEYAEIMAKDSFMIQQIMKKNNLRYAPQIAEKDPVTGKPKYKNLDKLKAIISPYSMRVTKEEAMPWLPPKVFQKRYFKLEKEQRKLYDALRKDMKAKLESDLITVMHKMTLLMRLQQVACGYVPNDEGKMIQFFSDPKKNPRIQEAMESREDTDGSLIIWARFQEDIRQLKQVFGDRAVTLYGPDSRQQRSDNLARFKNGDADTLISNEAVGGIGLNLTVSAKELFYNNSFSYEDRKQAEDRIHRGGQEADSCLYEDLIAEDTVDIKTVESLRAKEDMASYMTDLGDWREL